jgi:hypothetical protein
LSTAEPPRSARKSLPKGMPSTGVENDVELEKPLQKGGSHADRHAL